MVSYQQLNKPLHVTLKLGFMAQAFVFWNFSHSLPSFNLSDENTIETPLTSKKCHLEKFCKVDAWSQALHFMGETSFSIRFFSTFPRFPQKSKNRLNTSLVAIHLKSMPNSIGFYIKLSLHIIPVPSLASCF